MLKLLTILMFLYILPTHKTFGQTRYIDSLKKKIWSRNDADQKLGLIFSLCAEKQSLSTDSLFKYAQQAKALASQTANKKDKAFADYYIAYCLTRKGMTDSAMSLCEKTLASSNDKQLSILLNILKAQILMTRHQYKEATAESFRLLINAEKDHDTATQLQAQNTIGWAHMELDHNTEAISWFRKSIATTANPYLLELYTPVYSNLAAVYNTIDKNDSAQYFINKAIRYSRKHQHLSWLANSLNIQADIFIDTDRKIEAEASLREAINIRKNIGDPYYIVSDMAQLAIYYAHTNQPAKGIQLCLEGLAIVDKYAVTSKLPIIYDALAQNYKQAGDFVSYGKCLKR